MPNVRIGVLTAGVVAGLALAGCTGGATASKTPAARVPTAPLTSATPSPSGTAIAAAPAPGSTAANDQYAGMSPSDWTSIDQGLSDAQSALGQADTDAAHDEQGDATP